MNRIVFKESTKARFQSKVKKGAPEECWEWQAYRTKHGYGMVATGGGSSIQAQRMAWILENGEIPDGMCVCHRCDNPPCCNPAHLFLGTRADNVRDKVSKGRQARGEKHGAAVRAFQPKGEHAPNHKLTEAQVLQIRAEYIPKVFGCRKLAAKYGVRFQTILQIIHRTRWSHI